MQMSSSVKDIKFASKFMGLTLAAACSSGVVKFFTPIDPSQLKDWQENVE